MYSDVGIRKSKEKRWEIALQFVAILLAVIAIVLSTSQWWPSTHDRLNNRVDSANERLEALEKQMADLSNKSKIERSEELLSEMKAPNKTIDYTTSGTVQRVINELNNVKTTQRIIQKRLQALSHINDTAENYLILKEEIRSLTTHVNQNINRLELNVDENRREWQKALEKKTSEIDANISNLEKRLDREELENTNNRTNVTFNATSNATGVQGSRKSSYLVFYTIIFLVSLGVFAHV